MTKINLGLNPQGQVGQRWNAYRQNAKEEVRRRVLLNGKHCEGCGKKLDKSPDWSHLFGRRNIIKEPLASAPELTVGLDRKCHTDIDRGLNLELRLKLRWQGLEAFAQRHGGFQEVYENFVGQLAGDAAKDDQLALDCARAYERKLTELETQKAPSVE